jgi:hypothetical protein
MGGALGVAFDEQGAAKDLALVVDAAGIPDAKRFRGDALQGVLASRDRDEQIDLVVVGLREGFGSGESFWLGGVPGADGGDLTVLEDILNDKPNRHETTITCAGSGGLSLGRRLLVFRVFLGLLGGMHFLLMLGQGFRIGDFCTADITLHG